MPEWWQGSVGYEIYVRSFADSHGDGIGDLPGIRERLPYLADLGVDVIWMSPFFPSPQADHGYDVADYLDVDPGYGTLADLDALVGDAHALGLRVIIEKNESAEARCEATIRLLVNGEEEHTAASGNGPVHALDQALRKAISKFYPEVSQMQLSDYKVRVLNEKDGTNAKVRVLIDSVNNGSSWGTVGVSENIIEASWQALMESMAYYLQQQKITTENHS